MRDVLGIFNSGRISNLVSGLVRYLVSGLAPEDIVDLVAGLSSILILNISNVLLVTLALLLNKLKKIVPLPKHFKRKRDNAYQSTSGVYNCIIQKLH